MGRLCTSVISSELTLPRVPSTFAYFCEVHPSMVGSITVEPGSASSGIADADGDPGY